MDVTFEQIKDQLSAAIRKNVWDHALVVIDVIEAKADTDPDYDEIVEVWLRGTGSTTWLRDEIMEPLRNEPRIIEIGKQFNPTTEWHNTWMPLDAAMHRARNGIDPEEW